MLFPVGSASVFSASILFFLIEPRNGVKKCQMFLLREHLRGTLRMNVEPTIAFEINSTPTRVENRIKPLPPPPPPPPPPPLAILQQPTITNMPEFKLCRKTCNNRRLRTSQMTELQTKFQAEAAEFKALQKELQKVALRLRIFFADSRSISSAFFFCQAHAINLPLHD